MPKFKKPGKEGKKQPLLTPKERKEAKLMKKHAQDASPFLERIR